MSIIIEGTNGSGKSSLIEKLLIDLPEYISRKESKPPYDGFNYYLDTALNSNSANKIIFDRFHLGESVYPAIKTMENRKPLDAVQQHTIERALLSRGSVLIFAETDEESIIEVFRTRGEDYILESEVKQELGLFNEVYERSILPKIKYDYRDPASYEKVLDFITNNHTI